MTSEPQTNCWPLQNKTINASKANHNKTKSRHKWPFLLWRVIIFFFLNICKSYILPYMKADIQCILIQVQKQCEYTHWPPHNLEVRSVFNLEVSSGFNLEVSSGFNLEKRSGINNCVPSRNFIDFPLFFSSRDFFFFN